MIPRILCLFKRISATGESIVVLSKFKDLMYVKNDMLKFSWRLCWIYILIAFYNTISCSFCCHFLDIRWILFICIVIIFVCVSSFSVSWTFTSFTEFLPKKISINNHEKQHGGTLKYNNWNYQTKCFPSLSVLFISGRVSSRNYSWYSSIRLTVMKPHQPSQNTCVIGTHKTTSGL